jgi:co-chaperonin GroES (HSP10)
MAITAIKPCGNQILIELLTENELMNTTLFVPEGSQGAGSAPQGVVLDFGPQFDGAKWGVQKGDRVIVQGTFIPVPKVGNGHRAMGLTEFQHIKAVLVEG